MASFSEASTKCRFHCSALCVCVSAFQIIIDFTQQFTCATQVVQGNWYDSKDSNGYERRSSVTQFHDVIGYPMGFWICTFAQILNAIYILGVAIAQSVASSGRQYAIDTRYDKR